MITPVVWTLNNNKTCFFIRMITYITYHTHKIYIYQPVMPDSWGPPAGAHSVRLLPELALSLLIKNC